MTRARALNDGYDDSGVICLVSIAKRVCGPEVAAKLIADLGGADLFIPKNLRPDHPLVKSLGRASARAVCAEAHGVRVYVPMSDDKQARRRALVQLLTAEGRTVAEIARTLHCSDRTINKDRADLRALGVSLPRQFARRQAQSAAPAQPMRTTDQ